MSKFRVTKFKVDVVLSVVFALGAIITAIVPDWIEAVFRVDPDHGNGSLEWALVAVLGVLAMLFAVTARRVARALPA